MKNRFALLLLCMVLTAMQAFAQPRSISNVRVAPHDTVQNETTIAVNPTNQSIVFTGWNDFRSNVYSQEASSFSMLAGTNSTYLERATLPAPAFPYQDRIYSFDPCVSYDNSGNLFYSYVASNNVDPLGFTCVAKSTNNGYNWNIVKVSSPATLQDKPWNTVDNSTSTYAGRIYVAWTDFSNNSSKIMFSYSSDHGTNFSTPYVIDERTTSVFPDAYSTEATSQIASTNYVQCAIPATGSNGEVYLIWVSITDKNVTNGVTLKFAKSTNGGASFSSPQSLAQFTYPKQESGGWKIPGFPSITIDPSNGVVNIVYVDRIGATATKIKFLYSADNGDNFSSPTVVGDLGTGRYLLPYITNDKNGILSLAYIYFYNVNTVDVYITENLDGFSTPVKITAQPSTVTADYFPDYIGIASTTDGHRYISWSDNRSHATNTYVGDVNYGPVAPGNVTVVGSGRFKTVAKVTWVANTESEMHESGAQYEIYRGTSATGTSLIATVDYTTTSYTDNDVTVGSGGMTIYYRLRAKGSNNYHSPYSGDVSIGSSNWQQKRQLPIEQLPEVYNLGNNFPNPFNPTTNINYQIPNDEFVTVKVFDALGREMKTLVNEFRTAGYYSINFDASTFVSGIYYYTIHAGGFSSIKKMVFIK